MFSEEKYIEKNRYYVVKKLKYKLLYKLTIIKNK